VHLANIHTECARLRTRLKDSKREVLSRRSSMEQIQLASVLDTMIAVSLIKNKSVELFFTFI
jgi:hypothetical protein